MNESWEHFYPFSCHSGRTVLVKTINAKEKAANKRLAFQGKRCTISVISSF